MTVIISFNNINHYLKPNNSEEWSGKLLVIDNKITIISPYGCTNCQGGGCGICTPRS
jgi:hypothetical protein